MSEAAPKPRRLSDPKILNSLIKQIHSYLLISRFGPVSFKYFIFNKNKVTVHFLEKQTLWDILLYFYFIYFFIIKIKNTSPISGKRLKAYPKTSLKILEPKRHPFPSWWRRREMKAALASLSERTVSFIVRNIFVVDLFCFGMSSLNL